MVVWIVWAGRVVAAVAVVVGHRPSRLHVQPLEKAVGEGAGEGEDRERAERVGRADGAHEEAAEDAAGAFAEAEEKGAHEAHHAGDGVGRGNLGHVGDRRRHHQGHGETLEGFKRVHVRGVGDERVAQQSGRVGEHADDDDVHVADDVGDGAGEDEEGEAGHHPDGHRPPHEKVRRAEVVQVPKQEGLDEAPEGSREHHHAEEDHDLGVARDGTDVAENTFAGRLEVQLDHQDDGGRDQLEPQVNVNDGRVVGPAGRVGHVVGGLRGDVDDVASEGRKHDGAEVPHEPLDAVVSAHLLHGGHHRPLEHHQRGGREDAQDGPHHQVGPKCERRVVDYPGVSVVAHRVARYVDQTVESAAGEPRVDQGAVARGPRFRRILTLADWIRVHSRNDLGYHFLGTAVHGGSHRQTWKVNSVVGNLSTRFADTI